MVFVKFYQDSLVLLAVIQPLILFLLEKLALSRKWVVLEKCICYKMWEKSIDSFKWLVKSKLFFQIILYSGKENEIFVSTRKRLYRNQKYKNNSRLIPVIHTVDEHLKWADLQTFIWRQCMENIKEYTDPIGRGWKTSTEGLCSLWFSCE